MWRSSPSFRTFRESHRCCDSIHTVITSYSIHYTKLYDGDATLLLHLGTRAETDISVLAKPTSEEETILFAAIKAKLATDPSWYSTRLAQIKGVTEERNNFV